MKAVTMREIIPKRLSILVCTRNRRVLLTQMLDSFIQCRIPAGWNIEMIVVDNGSTDGTSEAVAAATTRLPFPVRGLVEPAPGLGRAHATGLAACTGELIACTDDDCVVSPIWCEAIIDAFTAQPELGGLFGRVIAYDDGSESVWRVALKTKEERATYRFPCWPIIGFGNNMAYRRVALESIGGFNPLFGPGGALWSAEELEVTYRLLRAGWAVAYEPSVQLWHRARTTFEGWKRTHRRDALGIGGFAGSYGMRGDGFAWKFAWWNWQGMAASWWRGVVHGEPQKRQVGGWYTWWLPLGLLAGAWHGLWRHPAPRLSGARVMRASPAGSSSHAPAISVVICTRNRVALLKEALESVLQSRSMAPGEYEVVVVDNGSHDGTQVVVEAARQRSPCALTYVFEPRTGLSRARNAGLTVARGEFTAFTDDDCLVAPDWLHNVVEVFRQDEELSGVCGRVLPHGGKVTSSVVSVKTAASPKRFRFPCSPFVGHGNNMVFRRRVLEQIGGFDVALGPGGPMRAAEEFDVVYRLLRRGDTLAYEPRCVVRHRARVTKGEARATEWRNAIGLGACLGKHMLRGDLFALKCVYWLLSALPSTVFGVFSEGGRQDLTRGWLFFIGVPCGIARWCAYWLGRGRTRIAEL